MCNKRENLVEYDLLSFKIENRDWESSGSLKDWDQGWDSMNQDIPTSRTIGLLLFVCLYFTMISSANWCIRYSVVIHGIKELPWSMFQQTLQEITLSYIWVPGIEGLFPSEVKHSVLYLGCWDWGLFPSEVKTPAPSPSSLPTAAGLYIVKT